jgi:hypothetical protein
MKTKLILTLSTLFVVSGVFAQSNLNNYKYVIVPNKFDFLKEDNQYQLNDLTGFLFKKYGFEAVKEDGDYPEDLALNRCLALKSDVLKDSGLFKTKLKIQLKDCNNRVVFTSKLGETREKEYKTAYQLALRDAFTSFEALNYKYKPSEKITSIATSSSTLAKKEASKEIEQLKQEIENLKKEKEAKVVVTEAVKVNAPKVVAPTPKVVNAPSVSGVIEGDTNILYAQAVENGFQLVDSSPKVVYKIKSTNLKDVFLVEGKSALIYKKGNDWIVEYYSGNTLKQETLNIKF